MEKTFFSGMYSVTIVTALVILMIFFYWLGMKLTSKFSKEEIEKDFSSLGMLQGSLMGLLALVVAFTFNMSAAKYEQRRQVIIDEANCIGTALLRCDLYPDSVRNEFRKDFKEYIESRIFYYEAKLDDEAIKAALEKSGIISGRIWKRAMYQSRENNIGIVQSNMVIPALNSMIDIVTTRDALRTANIPDSILWLMFSLSFISSFFIGFGRIRNKYSWMIILSISLTLALATFHILDLDRPRQGLITNDAQHQKMIELRKMLDGK